MLRATGAGVLAALLALLVFAAAALGGAAGAWQAALAGVSGRRAIVVVGAVCPTRRAPSSA